MHAFEENTQLCQCMYLHYYIATYYIRILPFTIRMNASSFSCAFNYFPVMYTEEESIRREEYHEREREIYYTDGHHWYHYSKEINLHYTADQQ